MARARINQCLELDPTNQPTNVPTVDFSQLQLKTKAAFQGEDFQEGSFELIEAKALDLHASNQGTPFWEKEDTTVFGIDAASWTYALKIVRDETDFETDHRAQEKLGKDDSDFYALALVLKDGAVTELAGYQDSIQKASFSQLDSV